MLKSKSISKEQSVLATEAELAVDVIDAPNAVVVQAAIAGIKPKDVTVSLSDSTVTIRGSRKQLADFQTDQYVVNECYSGFFSRSIMVPFRVAASAVTAILDKGILTITIPRPNATSRSALSGLSL